MSLRVCAFDSVSWFLRRILDAGLGFLMPLHSYFSQIDGDHVLVEELHHICPMSLDVFQSTCLSPSKLSRRLMPGSIIVFVAE